MQAKKFNDDLGWMDGWMGGWMGAYRNKKMCCLLDIHPCPTNWVPLNCSKKGLSKWHLDATRDKLQFHQRRLIGTKPEQTKWGETGYIFQDDPWLSNDTYGDHPHLNGLQIYLQLIFLVKGQKIF